MLAHFADVSRAQSMWFAFAQVLASHGDRALTFNFRGYCPGGDAGCSPGTFVKSESWRDIVAAADFLRAHGSRKIFVMGAGLGGHSALWAAAQPAAMYVGVISVSSPQAAIGGPASYDLTPAVLRRIALPKLFIAGTGPEAEAVEDARSMYAMATEPKQLALLPSSQSGPALFTAGSLDDQRNAAQVVLDFIAGHG